MATKRKAAVKSADMNPDPITGEPGSHPIGTGVGAALGGAAAGAAAGAVGGPIGAVVGAIAGGVGGGLAGKATAESIDPTAENEYWEQSYPSRPYFDEQYPYTEYAPAYRTGWEARSLYPDAAFDDVETDVQQHWEKTRSESKLDWDRARPAVRDAWDRIDERRRREIDRDML